MKPLKILYNVIVVLLVAVAVLLAVSVLPLTGNLKFLTVLSGSMEPSIHTGSIVVVKPRANYQVGDIITFGKLSKTQTPTTHRIFEIKEANNQKIFVTKGDANDEPDMKEINQNEIIGKSLFSVPYLGYLIDAAKKPFGFIAIIIIPAALIVFDEIKKLKKEISKIKKGKVAKDMKQDEEIEKLEEKVVELKEEVTDKK